jgi:hypothetical protein
LFTFVLTTACTSSGGRGSVVKLLEVVAACHDVPPTSPPPSFIRTHTLPTPPILTHPFHNPTRPNRTAPAPAPVIPTQHNTTQHITSAARASSPHTRALPRRITAWIRRTRHSPRYSAPALPHCALRGDKKGLGCVLGAAAWWGWGWEVGGGDGGALVVYVSDLGLEVAKTKEERRAEEEQEERRAAVDMGRERREGRT